MRAPLSRLVGPALVLTATVVLGDEPPKFHRIPPRSPAEALATFETRPGFEMQLVASEPLVASPVAIEYDEWGRGWVLEMHDYPFTDPTTDKAFADKSADPPLGRIRILQDTDQDGVFDSAVTFAEGISWPTGLAFWKGGVFVAATPDLWYLKDETGDGVADVRQRLYTGFRKFNIQAVINNLRWGLDHQIYGAGGSNGGSIQSLLDPVAPPVVLGVADFRLNPVERSFAVESGGARFGHALDDFGNRFLCNIRNPVIHVVLPARYLARNPYVAVRGALFDCAATGDTLPVYRSSPPEAWRAFRAARWTTELEGSLYPKSELVPGGYFTSASGVTLYRGDQWPAAAIHPQSPADLAAFTASAGAEVVLSDVASNIVHRQWLAPEGVTFRSRRMDAQTEFVRSTDIWFRPVNFTNAPDGTLHIVDMYRETIEHPWSIPDDIKAVLDLRSGSDRGRIWRIAPAGLHSAAPAVWPGELATEELVPLLGATRGWWRDTAARLLFERQDPSAEQPLRELARAATSSATRVVALWALQGLGRLAASDVLNALTDSAGTVREQAVLLGEPMLASSPEVLEAVLGMADDPAPRVRLQAAFTLGENDDPSVVKVLARIARQDAGDEFVRAAILSGVANRAGRLLDELLADREFAVSPAARPLLRATAQSVGGRRDGEELSRLQRQLQEQRVTPENRVWKIELVQGVGEGLRRTGRSLTSELPGAAAVVDELLADACRTVESPDVPADLREQAIALLTLGRYETVRDPLLVALGPSQPGNVQLAAVRALASLPAAELPALLLERWGSATPALRGEIVEALVARTERIGLLLDAVEQGRIGPGLIAPSRRGTLIRHPDIKIRARARVLFGAESATNRRDVVAQYLHPMEGKPDRIRGEQVFVRECTSCHRMGDKGHPVGPNLETVRHHAPRQLLEAILDPNREVTPAYVEYSVQLQDGRLATGLIAEETPVSITLRRANNVQEILLRSSIAELNSTGVSLMPEGLEKKISPSEMQDLLRWLTGGEVGEK